MTPVNCDVWWAGPGQATGALLGLLDDAERERHARFRVRADRDRYAVAHALARLTVGRAAGCDPRDVAFTLHCRGCERRPDPRPGPHGKPRPAGAAEGLEISISHSGARVVVALARGVQIGVDVEEVTGSRDIDGLAEYALTGPERADLAALPDAGRAAGFFGYWARKEALLKSTGDGLSGGLANVAVNAPDRPARVTAWNLPDAPGHVWLTDLDAGPGYRAALAALTPGPVEVTAHDAAPLLAL
ncbi:4'-phosphopantetheinyl transferase family protein [Nocardiopsis mangrovi]|uniref:4'-phosphopantetheinyl transferase family protein n=1 Tax=Nocardiopsis mangrovi TaxID=1179818 RepID=A0ABV9E5G1_9ACTN